MEGRRLGSMSNTQTVPRAIFRPDARATDAQLAYLKRLLIQAFSRRVSTCYDWHHLDRVTRGEASAEIGRLVAALKGL